MLVEDILVSLRNAIDREVELLLELRPRLQKLHKEFKQHFADLDELSSAVQLAARDLADAQLREFLLSKSKFLQKQLYQLKNALDWARKEAPKAAKAAKQLKIQLTMLQATLQYQAGMIESSEVVEMLKENLSKMTELVRQLSKTVAKIEVNVMMAEELMAKCLQIRQEIEQRLEAI